AKLMGCFYVESPAMRMLLTKLKAEQYLDLVAASSIIRPGVAQSGMMQEYIKRFHEPDHGKSRAIPELWAIMEETFGVMVYQEDVIKVAYNFGGFSYEEADKLRRGMGGKYRGRQEFLEVKEKFFSNCREKGKAEDLISKIWFQMETFGGYAFAKGHSASYAVESYQCMFLKTHYPLEYMVAVINNEGGFFGKEYYIHEARMCGATIHAPEVNKSHVLTTIHGKNIYLGLNLIAEFEFLLQQEIVAERNRHGEFSSLENFIRRVSIPVEQLRLLIRMGAFRFTGRTKTQLLWDIYAILGRQKKSVARSELFEGENKKYVLPELFSDAFEEAKDAIEILGFPLCSPFELIKQPLPSNLLAADFKALKNKMIEITGYYVTRKPTSTKKGEPMMFGCFLDRNGFFFDTNHFPAATKNFPFRGKGCYLIKGKVAEEFGFYSINVTEMQKLDYLMYEEDAETKARSRPDPVITPVLVPASKQYQYLLVINPPPHIRNEVELLKKSFHRHFDHYQAVVSKPHITLCTFLMSGAKEAEVVKQIAAVAGRHAAFNLSLKNFDSISSHTIYIDVLNPYGLVNVVTDLKKELHFAPKEGTFMLKPRLTIARGLDKEKFSRASAIFCERPYTASFVAGSMLLLKKETALKFGKYEVVREFNFEGVRRGVAVHA
ncbi:MAG: 2'-5' RNA ligase family protein, partial [Chitinophagales bacterium]